MIRIIPVLDIRRGRAVRALAGDRDHYGPLRSVVHDGTDPVALARSGRDTWALPDLYLADLDAILGESPADAGLYRALRDLGLTLWVDAGVRGPDDLAPIVEAGVDRAIVGLETVRGPDALREIVETFGADRVVFSLDLRQGRPIVDARPAWGTDSPSEIASRAVDAGVTRLIHLDLARVGTGRGVEAPAALPMTGVEWIVGGGIADIEEIHRLDRAGFHGVLVGSALHDGTIGAGHLKAFDRGGV